MPTQTFNSSGTFNVPSGVTTLACQAWGEGGNGKSEPSSGSNGGGGGGGGEFAEEASLSVTSGGTLTVTIGTGGTVTAISVAENSTGDSEIGTCIVEKIRGWPFPPAEEGAVEFVYPFLLQSGG